MGIKEKFRKRVRQAVRYMRRRGRLKINPKRIKMSRWVNDLIKRSMKIPEFTSEAVISMQTKTGKTDRKEHILRMDTDSAPIGIDNRCSLCISNKVEDFVGEMTETKRKIKGFGGVLSPDIKVGTILWRWEDDKGQEHKFLIPGSLYVQSGGCRLLSPQHWAQTRPKHQQPAQEVTTDKSVTLQWGEESYTMTTALGMRDNVASFQMAPGYKNFEALCQEATPEHLDEDNPLPSPHIVSDDEETINGDDTPTTETEREWTTDGTPPHQPQVLNEQQSDPEETQQPRPVVFDFQTDSICLPTSTPEIDSTSGTDAALLLRYHYKYGHTSFKRLKKMAEQGIIPKRLQNTYTPTCLACQFAKATRRPWRHKKKKNFKPPEPPTKPGQVVSVDQLVSPTPGLIAQMTGILTTKRYKYATIYVDHYSKLSYLYLQKTASVEETLQGKQAFESYAASHGVSIMNYHADNGVFRANEWIKSCQNTRHPQGMTFSGVDAHHTNGVAERRIRELQDNGRAMMIHAHHRWKTHITHNLWPYALRMANHSYNNTPLLGRADGKTPLQLFTSTEVDSNPKHWKPFGCPSYVLTQNLRAGARIHHKWKNRANLGIYLGHSPVHHRNVALILNPNTGLVSPQFHVRFDPEFITAKEIQTPSHWQYLAGFVRSKANTAPSRTTRHARRQQTFTPLLTSDPILPNQEGEPDPTSDLPALPPPYEGIPPPPGPSPTSHSDPIGSTEDQEGGEVKDPEGAEMESQKEDGVEDSEGETMQNLPKKRKGKARWYTPFKPTDMGKRRRKAVDRLEMIMETITKQMIGENESRTADHIPGEIFTYNSLFPTNNERSDLMNEMDPVMAFKSTSDPDTMYLHEAMREKDRANFLEAMWKEIQSQIQNENFTLIKKEEVPSGCEILPCVWQMKRKRDIKTRKIRKWKARLNVDGSRMKRGIHYDKVYAPVASWSTIRLILILILIEGWETKQIDYVQAFPQAPAEKDLYLKVPSGFEVEGGDKNKYALKLHKNVYGQKQAGRVWYKYLTNKLVNNLGFKQSKIDECLFYRGKTIYLLYTDDSILAGPDKDEITQIMKELKGAGLDITDEGNVEDFLGVNIDRKETEIHLTQPHLIQQILKDLHLDHDKVTSKTTPSAASKILFAHKKDKPFDGSFHYRSVIGKLNYLEKSCRPDIAYIVHQCARFSTDPRKKHADAIRWLGKYLKGTAKEGVILRPEIGRGLEVYVDADFAGNWNKEESEDRDTARSRHGYVIMYQGCPILHKSQLQTEIALSSTESEYTGLSYALREAIPIMRLLRELKSYGYIQDAPKAQIKCKVYEDNSGALEMAKEYKYRPRTKFLNIKLHHFRDYVERGEIKILKVSTDNQHADYLTKPLNEVTLQRHRRAIQGW